MVKIYLFDKVKSPILTAPSRRFRRVAVPGAGPIRLVTKMLPMRQRPGRFEVVLSVMNCSDLINEVDLEVPLVGELQYVGHRILSTA